jgi:1,2-diacylglycerol 3-beta-glucosyltransferase
MLLTALATTVAFGLVASIVLTLALARRTRPGGPHRPPKMLWVFVVPALDEAPALRRTLDSLLAIDDDRTRVLVVDDAAIAAGYPRSQVWLLHPHRPLARKGKAAALNHAYQVIRRHATAAGVPTDQVILGIVDGDAHLAPDVTHVIGPAFADPTVGAVQVQVRAANRRLGWLPRLHDVELLTSSRTRRARRDLGRVGLGGNGHFTRLAALESLGNHPWTDCPTEELELGLRLGAAGWQARSTGATELAQHAPTDLRRATRQRTRSMQGHLQCWRHVPALVRSPLPTVTVLDLLVRLATPLVTLVASVVYGLPSLLVVVSATWLVATGAIGADAWPWLVLAYLLVVGPALALSLLYRHRARELSLWRTVALAHLLTLYSAVWYVAAWRALGRVLTGRRTWTSTGRRAHDGDRHRDLEVLLDTLVTATPRPSANAPTADAR